MTFVADTLTSGSHPGSNMPGRRREDDTNIVPALVSRYGKGTDSDATDAMVTAFHMLQDPVSEENSIAQGTAVRRLTPRECERLQGFPDDWTALGPDSRRYAALGDAVTVNVSEWIGRRIIAAEAMRAAA